MMKKRAVWTVTLGWSDESGRKGKGSGAMEVSGLEPCWVRCGRQHGA